MNDEAGGRAGERRRGRSESGVFGLPAGYGERGRWCGWCAVGWSQDRKRCCRVWGGLAALRVGGCSRGSSVAVMNCER